MKSLSPIVALGETESPNKRLVTKSNVPPNNCSHNKATLLFPSKIPNLFVEEALDPKQVGAWGQTAWTCSARQLRFSQV